AEFLWRSEQRKLEDLKRVKSMTPQEIMLMKPADIEDVAQTAFRLAGAHYAPWYVTYDGARFVARAEQISWKKTLRSSSLENLAELVARFQREQAAELEKE